MKDRSIRLEADARAHRTVTKPAAITWPLPVDRRLDQLVELANDAGARTNRAELAAALVAAAVADSTELLERVLSWRTARVRDIVERIDADAEVIELPRFGPGRRRANS